MSKRIQIAVGPQRTEFGSWNWLGQGLVDAMLPPLEIVTFEDQWNPPTAEVVVFVKFKPPVETLRKLREQKCRLVYMPVDIYASALEIDTDLDSIRCFDMVVVHSQRLIRYFNCVSRVEFLVHPLKYVLQETRTEYVEGPLLWIGRRCNIAPVVDWANQQPKLDLWVLTNTDGEIDHPKQLGFQKPSSVRLETWTESMHIHWLAGAGLAIDIKGTDFRARHKPPAKAFDYLASGVPVLTNQGSSVALEMHLRGLPPLYADSLNCIQSNISPQYISECSTTVRKVASPDIVWHKFQEMLMRLMAERCHQLSAQPATRTGL